MCDNVFDNKRLLIYSKSDIYLRDILNETFLLKILIIFEGK